MSTDATGSAAGRLSIVLYAQHLSGVGHYVRTWEIARELAAHHDVRLVEGGRPVPRRVGGPSIQRIVLPRLVRGPSGLEPMEKGRELDAVLRERRRLLEEGVASARPDVLIIEHFPFSKWELGGEILAAVEAARAAVPGGKVACSIRDVVRRTRHETGTDAEYSERVIELLNDHFDAVLVHGDPQLARLEEHFPAAAGIGVPVYYTGIVSERPGQPGRERAAPPPEGEYVLVSSGGGAGDMAFPELCIAAWRRLRASGAAAEQRMFLFTGVDWPQARLACLRELAGGDGIEILPFSVDFLEWMRSARLVVTHAGYNTCANILETGCPALLVPDPQMSDQGVRAARLAQLGLVDTLSPEGLSPDRLADAMLRAGEQSTRACPISLDGAMRTREIIEGMVARPGGSPSPATV